MNNRGINHRGEKLFRVGLTIRGAAEVSAASQGEAIARVRDALVGRVCFLTDGADNPKHPNVKLRRTVTVCAPTRKESITRIDGDDTK